MELNEEPLALEVREGRRGLKTRLGAGDEENEEEPEVVVDALPEEVELGVEVDVELGVAELDAVADADSDDEPVWVPLEGAR
jgi:hypothetical protein